MSKKTKWRHRVEYDHPKTGHVFGVWCHPKSHGEEDREGYCLVEHALTGEMTWVPEDIVKDCEDDFRKDMAERDEETGNFIGTPYSAYMNDEWKKHKAISDACDGVEVGAMFSIGVADGSAHYVIVKVNPKTVDVEWRGFCPDRWRDHHFGNGGRFSKSDVERYVKRTQGLKKLFAAKKT